MQSSKRAGPEAIVKQGVPPKLNIKKIGIVSRDYRCEFPNGRRDFSHMLPEVLKLLDRNGCDAAVFSLFSIVSQESHGLSNKFARLRLRRIKAIFLEEFRDWPKKKKEQREAERNVVYHCSKGKWLEYEYHQKVSRGNDPRTRILSFVSDEMPKRILGNCCVVLCGESNGVKYSMTSKKVTDRFGVRAAIPQKTNIILNPIHDRMTRPEMKLKRTFLSEKGRWVISVWNKGKEDKNGRTRDGSGPAWTVFHNGVEKVVEPLPNELGIEIGILDFGAA
jgi:hypothetical protein